MDIGHGIFTCACRKFMLPAAAGCRMRMRHIRFTFPLLKTMKPKHKQSSLLSFFKKPKAAAASSNKSSPVPEPRTPKFANNNGAQDANEAVIAPTSPHADEEKIHTSSTIIVSPAAVEVSVDTDVSETLGATNEGDTDSKPDGAENTESQCEGNTAACGTASISESTADEEDNSSESEDESDKDEYATPKKSDYELLRERNIERNNARLKSLGLLTDAEPSKIVKKKPTKRKKTAGIADRVSYPTRRSTRMRKTVLGDDGVAPDIIEAVAAIAEHAEQPEEITEEEQFTVSALFEYNMSDNNRFSEFEYKSNNKGEAEMDCKNLVPNGPCLIPPSGLNALYSLQFYPPWDGDMTSDNNSNADPSWLVGAGKSGIVALWDCRRPKEDGSDGIDPIISWKAHGGRWVADAKFFPCGSSSMNENPFNRTPKRLLTAANDGTICQWDLTSNSVKTGAPKLLGQTNKSLHASGIFSMDVRVDSSDVFIASGSKDKTISLTTVERFGNACWRSDFHSAKVGCVSLSSGANPLIVSASDDGFVAVHDSRSDSVAAKIEDPHFKPHSAVWRPGSDNVFLTAGLDETIKLWDARNTLRPLASFHGHVPKTGKRMKRIHRPTFMETASESFILSGGEGSYSLSMYQLSNLSSDGLHTVFSRGKLPEDHGDIGSIAVANNNVAVAGEGGEVLILSPQAN